ncbi:uncharacterized protein B0T15DRAFT_164151 [Chaetomium strumarium]|uniref:Uncharacterized protein n=1 Tax=Chaetomium strumarium TaxID=1170767 RepID=A0AAJ0M380_9PEZI|nr:hypothetical protein B0T15DRAFT_164151 [Chaetomium strumarium]
MGLLDFFSRKAGNKGKTNVALKPPVCDSAAARSLPAPAGDHKPARRPYYVGTLQGGRPDFTQSQLSFDTVSEDERSAPAPRVPVFPGESVERPSTAPGTRPPSTLFRHCDLREKTDGRRRGPPLSLRMARPETPAAGFRPGSRGSIATPANVFRRGSEQSGAPSLRSAGGKTFKDILDAQSEIRPADFRERVRAAGTRDYGEDVAERNLSRTGPDIAADHVRTFQADIGIEPLRSSSQQNLHGHMSPETSLLLSSETGRREAVERRRSFSTFIHLSSDHSWKSPSALRLPEVAPAPAVRTERLPRDSVELAKKRADASATEHVIGYGSPPKAAALHSATRSRRSSTVASAASVARKHHSLYTLRSSVSSSVLSRDTMIHPTPLSYPHRAIPRHQADQELAEDSTGSVHSMLSEDNDGLQIDPPSVETMFTTTQRTNFTFGDGEAVPPPSSQNCPLFSNPKDPYDTSITLPDRTMGRTASLRTRRNRPLSTSSDAPTATDSFVTAASHPFHSPPPSLGTADTLVDLDASVGAASPRPKTPGSIHHGDMIYVYSNSKSRLERGKGQDRGKSPETVDTFNIDDYLSTDTEADSVATTPNRRPTAEGEEDLLFNDAGYGASGMQLPGLPDPFPVSPSFFSADANEEGVIKDGGDDKINLLYMARLYGLEAGYWDYGIGVRSDESLVGTREHRLMDEQCERRRRTRRFVLDTAADDEDESRSGPEWDLGWRGRERRVGLGLGREVDDDDDDGYDADFIDDNWEEHVEGEQRRSPRQHMRKRTRRLSALYRVDDDQMNEEQSRINQSWSQQDARPEQQQSDTAAEVADKVDIADAARLRKEAKRARRLAGMPSLARLRRQARMSMPELRLE